ncbi:YceD family protein [Flavobacteriaceae bacterium 14752]|uniref:YceD family protein n=1 Tax=Mesohalobacter salilacus TaxID=2491711 RepID=UPI000F6358EB|nr:DUF177 domain-containing protein [Flavobacteriaceae bacterium 14752]
MLNLEDYAIHFVGLKEGEHQFEYKINNAFFDEFDYQEFLKSDIQVEVNLIKKSTHLEFDFHIKGQVEVECDLTLESFNLPIENSLSLVVKFGDEFKEVDDELLYIPHGQYEFQIEQFIYECVILAIPQKKIHPGVEDGTLDSEILEKLNQHSIDKEDNLKNKEIDPRWDKLKKLLKD